MERWAEDSGNAGLAGRELPPAEVLAADQRVTAWARQLRQAGLDGDMDQLRARAFMDLLLGTDSRPLASNPGSAHGQDSAHGQEQRTTARNSAHGQEQRRREPPLTAPAARARPGHPIRPGRGSRRRPGRWPG